MAPQGKQTSVEQREIIVRLLKEGKSVRDISAIVDRAPTTVFNIIKRYKNTTNFENKAKPSGRKIFLESDESWLLQNIRKNPHTSAPKLAADVEKYLGKKAIAETIRNVLRKHHYHGRVARKKPFVSKANIKKLMEFAKNMKTKDFSFWEKVIFTDESKFNIFRSDRQSYVWRKPNEELKKANLRPTIKHGLGSVIVWGAISAAGPGNLHIVEGNMEQIYYLNLLKANLKESARKLGLESDFIFYQDNDPKHKAYVVRNWLLYNCRHVLDTPPQSPDLNVVEHVWNYLEQKLKNHHIKNKTELVNALKEEWNNIPVSYCHKLVESTPNRLKAVIKQKGLPTKY